MFSKCITYTCPIRVYCVRAQGKHNLGDTLIKGEYNEVTGCDYLVKMKR